MKPGHPFQKCLWRGSLGFMPRNRPLKPAHPLHNTFWGFQSGFMLAGNHRFRVSFYGFGCGRAAGADAGAGAGREGLDRRAFAFGSCDKAAVPGFGPLHNSCPDAGMRSRFGRSLPPLASRGGISLIIVFCRATAQAQTREGASSRERPVLQGARPGYAEPRHPIIVKMRIF